jgi:ferredoxin--NADP+ reductase
MSDAHLLARVEVARDLAFFRLHLDAPLAPREDGEARFVPGQYITVGAAGPDGAVVRRPLTVTRVSADGHEVEVLLNRVTAPATPHPLSHLLFELAPGAPLFARPVATGHFTLADTVGRSGAGALWVASESGLAPFLAMARAGAQADLPTVTLVHAVSDPTHLAARAELEATLGPAYRPWRVEEDGPLEGLADALADAVDLAPARTQVLACGLGADLEALARGLLPRGYLPAHRRLRKALGIPSDAPTTLHLEQYDAARMFADPPAG